MSPTTIPGNFVIQSPAANDPLLDLNTQPSLDLQFATSKTLNDRVSGQNLITFSRSTTGTYVDSNGIIQTAAIDAPRFDHDPTTNASLGLLVEESRENLVTNSEDLTGWSTIFAGDGVNPTVQNISDTAPDGGTTVTEITFQRNTANTSDYSLYREQYGTTAVSTGSVYVKAARPSDVGKVIDFYHNQGAPIDFNSVTLTDTWQRVSSVGAGVIAGFLTLGLYSATSSTGQVKILAWGAQLEEGAFPTSYIPTSGSSVPRAADVASITGSNFSRWYNQSEGTFIATHEETSTRNVDGAVYGGGSQLRLFSYSNQTRVQFLYGSGTGYLGYSSSPSSPPAYVKTAFYYDGLSYGGTIQGLTPSNQTTTTAPSPSLFEIGRANTIYTFNGRIPRLTYYPYRLPDATLQEITS
jgi:hypothetical protein